MSQAIGLPRPSQRAANRSLSDILSFSGDIRYSLGRALALETEYKMWVESSFFARGRALQFHALSAQLGDRGLQPVIYFR